MVNNTIVALNHPYIRCVEEKILNWKEGYLLSTKTYCVRPTAPVVITVQPKINHCFRLRHINRNVHYLNNTPRGNFIPHPLFPGFYSTENYDHNIYYYLAFEKYAGEIEHRFYRVRLLDPGVYFGHWDTKLITTEYFWSRYIVCPNPPTEAPEYNYTDYWKPPKKNGSRDDNLDVNNLNFIVHPRIPGFYSLQRLGGDVWFYYQFNGITVEHRYYELMDGQYLRLYHQIWSLLKKQNDIYNYVRNTDIPIKPIELNDI